MSLPSCPTADFSRLPCYPAHLNVTATPCPRTPPSAPVRQPVRRGRRAMVHAHRQEAGCFTQEKPPLPYRPHGPIARAPLPVGMFHSVASGRHGPGQPPPIPSPPHPRNATQISVAQCFTSPAKPRKTTDLPGHGLCNTHNAHVSQGCAERPLPRVRACATIPAAMLRHVSQQGGDGGVRHRDGQGTPNETSPRGMFHRVAWPHPGPEPDAGGKGRGRLDSWRVCA